jgi:GNAT superfamily N-acetyltransferase
MTVTIVEESAEVLTAYASIPSRFLVSSVLDVVPANGGLGGLQLNPRQIESSYTKDYDAEVHFHPMNWSKLFDVTKWGFFTAVIDGRAAGRAAVGWNTPGVHPIATRNDLAVLWDIRVLPDAQKRGVGYALLRAAETWAAARHAAWLMAETQNNNLTACHFYQAQGFTLGAINRFAYPEFPEEAQLLWFKELK